MTLSEQHALINSMFSKEGLLGQALETFEERPEQQQMAGHILDAYAQDKIALIEAGTGTGKSLAYLFPAVYWALKHQEKTVIATHTIALQEQLLFKDIPFLLRVMGAQVKACLVKGMGNYLCQRRLQEQLSDPSLLLPEEMAQMQQIESHVERYQQGSFSSFKFPVSISTKEKVAAEAESCNHVHCDYYKECFFFKERKQASDAQILVVNQHLLLADVQYRMKNPEQEAILPSYQRVVIDEAHHFEHIALESLAQRWDRRSALRELTRLYSETHPEKSRLFLLRQTLSTLSELPPSLLQAIEIDIPSQKRVCQTDLDHITLVLTDFFALFSQDKKVRITPSLIAHPAWKETILPACTKGSESLMRLAVMVQGVLRELEAFRDLPIFAALSLHQVALGALAQRLSESSQFFSQFIQEESEVERVRWCEMMPTNFLLVSAALDIAPTLSTHLFSKQKTSVLCSATMAINRSFDALKKRIGLKQENLSVTENIFLSPFDYQQRVLFAVPTSLPLPSSADFLPAAIEMVHKIILTSQGSVFLLFTSYEMLQQCYTILEQRGIDRSHPFLKQGQLPRHLLLERFKQKEGSVLFATDSFWEGVDVPGEALRCVVMFKLPFQVPSDPLHQAYTESLKENGLDPFLDYSVPQAVIKFKQGFGRLMRQREDRGCIVCLDHRMVTKNYGRLFLQSLPPCRNCFGPQEEVLAQMKQFYATVK